jgi:hypothetical protein
MLKVTEKLGMAPIGQSPSADNTARRSSQQMLSLDRNSLSTIKISVPRRVGGPQ